MYQVEIWHGFVYLTGVCVLWLWNHLHSRIREISTVWGPGRQETSHLAVLSQPRRQQTSKCAGDISWIICVTSLSFIVFVSLSRGQTRPRWHRMLPGHLQLWPSTTPITYTLTDGVVQASSSKGWAKTQATCLVSALGTHRNGLVQWVPVRCRGSWELEWGAADVAELLWDSALHYWADGSRRWPIIWSQWCGWHCSWRLLLLKDWR